MKRHTVLFGCLVWLACPGGATTGQPNVQDVTLDNTQPPSDSNPPTPDLGPLPDGATCFPGQTQCVGSHFLTCNETGTDWTIETCLPGTTCTPQGCVATLCQPNQATCDEQGFVVLCLPDGSGYGEPTPCNENHVCVAGLCVPKACKEGDVTCAQKSVLICESGRWREEPCQEGQICFKGGCIECFSDSHCPEGLRCVEGVCVNPPLAIVTTDLPDAQVGTPYSAKLQAEGGQPPYTWSLTTGNLPDGLNLIPSGEVSGTPKTPGDFAFTVRVEDKGGASVAGDLSITVHGEGLSITSKSPLPDAEDGSPYSYQFKAIGGTQPYGWMLLKGALPSGLVLSYSGELSGVPSGPGPYNFTIRVVDSGSPLQQAAADFLLNVKVAPLQITGDQVINLFMIKAVILPLITVVEGIPIPYSVQLQAKGGVKPYHWAEVQIPSFIKTFLPKAGIPQGLTLSDSGLLSGAVTSTNQVMELQIPFVNFTLKGFFFMAEVKDSQSPPDSDQAIFLIPTVPVNLGGGLPF